MSGASRIEWTGATWNPIRARLKDEAGVGALGKLKVMPAGTWGYHCERVSPGCSNCYACAMNARTLPAWGTGLDYTRQSREKLYIYLDEDELLKPMHWKRGRFVFPCSMTDLFAEFVPDEFIDQMFAVMALCPQHTFQLLTKRAPRMETWFQSLKQPPAELRGGVCAERLAGLGFTERQIEAVADSHFCNGLSNVWLGVSFEDRQRYRDRVPLLRETPAAVRWLSIEPLLEDLGELDLSGIDWVVLGGESGPSARPCDLAWLRSVRDQCAAAGVPLFVKQIGARPVDSEPSDEENGGFDGHIIDCNGKRPLLHDRKGGDPAEWPADLRVREMPGARA